MCACLMSQQSGARGKENEEFKASLDYIASLKTNLQDMLVSTNQPHRHLLVHHLTNALECASVAGSGPAHSPAPHLRGLFSLTGETPRESA